MKNARLFIGAAVVIVVVAMELRPAVVRFSNSDIHYQASISSLLKVIKAYALADRNEAAPLSSIPVQPVSIAAIRAQGDDQVIKLSHSTTLVYLDQSFILIDPVFSERVSPVQWAGPKRFHPLPIALEALPEIAAVLISHDHYDHLDKHSILTLNAKVAHFITPLKVGERLREWGIPHSKITELNWWEATTIGSHTYTATPAQHFSGRGILDKDTTLWAGWAIKGANTRLFYSGDSGYFKGFKDIGERLGPFDMTLIETGAYNALWRDIHMLPEQSVQAHLDVKGKAMMPVHNASFDLALHDWYEPLERALIQAQAEQVTLITPIFGESISLKAPRQTPRWWQPLVHQSLTIQQ
ncbi:MBL fold metallo-hydrolase [Marinagarivorans algicola]|uniref:MBL fold metallo-hydrolase n=1 Tax=Marinagarivorans algicola TaxID=1513270 RepID=UPI0009E834AC|nr:MBL fold metallo-hydrolase [Marinagarivorans algicola]